jgi:hypothetical protein
MTPRSNLLCADARAGVGANEEDSDTVFEGFRLLQLLFEDPSLLWAMFGFFLRAPRSERGGRARRSTCTASGQGRAFSEVPFTDSSRVPTFEITTEFREAKKEEELKRYLISRTIAVILLFFLIALYAIHRN